MTIVDRIVAVTAGSAYVAPAAALFDEYRVHYGQAPEPERAGAWLSQQWDDGGLRLYLAIGEPPDHPVGLVGVGLWARRPGKTRSLAGKDESTA